ncbi:MAG: alpha-2-macroglobulin family protein, partial [Bacteroidales bacterium]
MVKVLPQKRIQLLVVHRISGKPIEGVCIACSFKKIGSSQNTFLQKVETDTNGIACLNYENSGTYLFKCQKGADSFLPEMNVFASANEIQSTLNPSKEEITFYTDRSVYRPGQAVFFKGIYYHTSNKCLVALSGKTLAIELINQHGEKIQTLSLTTDHFGAVSGEFIIPANGLNGSYQIQSKEGRCRFEVAEYKRPTFEVILQQPTIHYNEGDSITLNGMVKNYSGIGYGNSNVEYEVSYMLPWRFRNSEFVASGAVKTKSDGSFQLQFESSTIQKGGWYQVRAIATSQTGETQDKTILIPLSATQYNVTIPTSSFQENYFRSDITQNFWNITKPTSLTISVTDLNEKLVSLPGELIFYRLNPDTLAYPEIRKDTTRVLCKKLAFQSNQAFNASTSELTPGAYELEARITDSTGVVSIDKQIVVIADPKSKKLPIVTQSWVWMETTSVLPGSTVSVYFGSSAKNVYLFCQLFIAEGLEETKLVNISDEITYIEIPFKQFYGSNFNLEMMYVKENTVITEQVIIQEKEPNRNLSIFKESFRDKLLPGTNETWAFSVRDSDGDPVQAQILASMYDISLNEIMAENQWQKSFPFLSIFADGRYWQVGYGEKWQKMESWGYQPLCPQSEFEYVSLKDFYLFPQQNMPVKAYGLKKSTKALQRGKTNQQITITEEDGFFEEEVMLFPQQGVSKKQTINKFRTNLKETAFFYPNLLTDQAGNVKVNFVVPDALTRWKVRLLATTPEMKCGYWQEEVITAKDLMVVPNLPRFARQGDSVCIASMIQNQSGKALFGTVNLEIFNPLDEKIIYRSNCSFNCEANANAEASFCFKVPATSDLMAIRIKAVTDSFSDGEQQLIPILPARTLVTDAFPIYVQGKGNYKFRFDEYMNQRSNTRENLSYTVEYTGNPAWYAIQALPVLSDISIRSATNAIASFYVNTLANYIASQKTDIRKAVEWWNNNKKEKSFVSALEKNEQLKQTLLSETPWVMKAAGESANMQALSLLFDTNRLNQLQTEAFLLLTSLQNEDGGIAWFTGMPSSLLETLNVLEGFSQLVSLDAYEPNQEVRVLQMSAINYSDK